jgi:protein TonB
MKKHFLLLILIISSTTYSQTTEDNEKIYNNVELDKKPEFKGGIEKFYKYVGKNFQVPNVKGLKGKIIVEFVIEKDGSVSNFIVIQDIGFGTSEEITRVFKKCPNYWQAGIKDEKIVRSLYNLPITIMAAE